MKVMEVFDTEDEVLRAARRALKIEADAITAVADKVSHNFYRAYKLILSATGKLIVSGMGKSGHIGQKIASTMSSLGTPSVFVHPSEALHGDFGMFARNDCLLAISYQGETREILAVSEYARNVEMPVIAITGVVDSSLARLADSVLDGHIEREADILGIAPSSSSSVALAIGDALAIVLMRAKGITRETFAKLHPGGRLGRDLTLVSLVMRPLAELQTVAPEADFSEVIDKLAQRNFGIIAVVDKEIGLVGAISDGDIRRAVSTTSSLQLSKAQDVMSHAPKTLHSDDSAVEAVTLMERHKITSAFVVNAEKQLVGVVRLHDLIAAKII